LLPENAFTEDALIASYLVADPQNKALGGLSSGITAPDGIRNTSQLRVQDPSTPSVSTLVGAIGSDLLRFGKWVVATDTPTATDLLDFTWFETSFSFLATSFSGTFVGAQDIQFSVPNIPGATFEMTLTPGSLFTNPTFLYKTGSASQAIQRDAYTCWYISKL
jgi:hypothetical protein